MTSSKDGEGGESSGLTVVNGSHAAGEPRAREAPDKATSLQLAVLRQEHRELDEKIQALISEGVFDQLLMTRWKKRKLMLRDQIAHIENDILPDIIA